MLTPPTPDPAAPRVLLFGYPKSGKTHLLGALLQASETQPDVLGAEVIDPTGRLAAVRDAVYAGAPFENTRTELVSVPVFLRDPAAGRTAPAREFALSDCDGHASSALLKNPVALDARRVNGTVARAVLGADLIALVVDAGLTDDDLAERFEDFLFFLEQVHGRRLREREVGGLPVFVVVSRCDLLARPGDTAAEWAARVRGNMRYVLRQFEEFIADQLPLEGHGTSYLPFGSVDVEGYATAVRRPQLADEPDGPAEPFGVAEFFRAAFAAAAAHRDRARSSDRRLRRTVWAVAAAVGVMLGGAAAVAVFQPPSADPELPDRVRLYARGEPPAADRLAEKNLARNKRLLAGFRADPGFFALPGDLQGFVEGRLREAEDYQDYRAKLAAQAAPAEARTLDDLERIRTRLTTDLALPAEYTWGDTEAAKLRDKWLADVTLIRAAEAGWYDWYRGLVNQATALTLTGSFDGDWRDRVNVLADAARQPQYSQAAVIPGSEPVPQPRGEAVTYRVPFEYDRVFQARRDWEYARARLLHLRDLADALGLTPPTAIDGPRLLVIPPPGAVPATFLGDRLTELQKRYSADGYREWELAGFPDPARKVLAAQLRTSFGNGVRVVRGLVLDRIGGNLTAADTPEGWARTAAGLTDPPVRDWGRYLQLLARLENPAAPDPVDELAAFLRAPQFALDLRGAEVRIPLALRVPAVVPAGPLTVTLVPRAGGDPVVRAYPPAGEPSPRDLGVAYTFGPAPLLLYRPGDGLRAELPVRSGDQRFTLVWDGSGTRSFQFEAFDREPRLLRAGAPPEPATGVTLTPAAGSVLPRVPVLLPDGGR
ncbi:MAG TPA: hypothetical protein VH092_22445 [Urbifossiella sp.]|nr:hypothetical protein [Urbifossiella sp.]